MKMTSTGLLFTLFYVTSTLASVETDALFKQSLSSNGVSPRTEQAYCYLDDQGVVQGYNVSKAQRIASVTKIFTTLAALENASLNKTYQTLFYISGNNLHIQGGKDPYFEEEKMFFLLSALNKLGITKLDQVTFDENFYFADEALGTFEILTTDRVKTKINQYLNTALYNSTVKGNLKATRAFIKEENLDFELPTLTMSSKTVSLSSKNPLANKNPSIYTHQSRPLHAILKSMNTMSKNWIAEHLFNEFGGSAGIAKILTKYGISNSTYKIQNGSGLPMELTGPRFDNWATCNTVITVFEKLKLKVESLNFKLEDIVAVGTDHGTLEKRFKNDLDLKDGIIAKTGSLKHTSSLAGFLNFKKLTPFAVLNHTSNTSGARAMQEEFLSDFTREIERPLPIDYELKNIFPLDTDEFFIAP